MFLDYPKDKLSVYVLNDGKNKEENEKLKVSAEWRGFTYIERPNKGELKKAGNMRHAFPLTSGEFMLVLDADFAPRKDMIREIVHYFQDEKIAIVQTPQYFDIQDGHTWIQKGAAYVQELFYRLIQLSRDGWGAAICVGTCAMYRRTALEPFGGTAAIGYSEDLHTGFNCLKLGYNIKYIPVNLAKGVCPEKLSAYFTQQYRWCMGSTSLCFNSDFWKTKLPFMMRLNYLSGMFYYMSTALSIFITPVPSLFVTWFHPELAIWYNWMFSVPSFVFCTMYAAWWSKAPFGLYALRARQAAYYAHAFALYDKMRNTTMPWVPSGAASQTRVKHFDRFKNLCFFWTSAVAFVSIAGAFYRMENLHDARFFPMIAFNLFHYWIVMGIFKEEA